MNILEYQAKEILRMYGVRVPSGQVVHNINEISGKIKKIHPKRNSWVVKAQIPAGGRGKAGGIKTANSVKEVIKHVSGLLGSTLVTDQTNGYGYKIHHVLIEENLHPPEENNINEYFFCFICDRNRGKNMIIYSSKGGMDIELSVKDTPELIYKEEIDPETGLSESQIQTILKNLNPEDKNILDIPEFLKSIYKVYNRTDSIFLEINPAIKTSDNVFVAADIKMIIDDNALFRHPELQHIINNPDSDLFNYKEKRMSSNFIKLQGDIACMVNGAGLAMASMDMIKHAGKNPANFFDIGGSANTDTIESGIGYILKDPNIKAIFINIFGGIVRCDKVARGIINASRNTGKVNIPVILRLKGTNSKKAKQMIIKSGLDVIFVEDLKDAQKMIKKMNF